MFAGEHTVESKLPQLADHCGHVAMRSGAYDLEGVLEINAGGGVLSSQDLAKRVQLGARPMGEVGERACLDVCALAVAFAQQGGWRRGAIGDIGNVHAY